MILDALIVLLLHLAVNVCAYRHTYAPRVDTPNTIKLLMPGSQPTKNDQYFCTYVRVDEEELYITRFNPHGDAGKAHHMLLYGCEDVDRNEGELWDCGHERLCTGMKILFAWAKNAPPTVLPPSVGFLIGNRTTTNYLLLQVHYVHPLPPGELDHSGFELATTVEKQKYLAGIYLMLRGNLIIPPRTAVTHGDINCQANTVNTIHPFAFRVHAHALGSVITGYKFDPDTEQFTLLGKGNPQWPQAFYPMEHVQSVKPTDYLVARCTFNSTKRDRYTTIGSTAADEMCNLYIMYYTDSTTSDVYHECVNEERPDLIEYMPADSDQPLPPNESLEEHARVHHHEESAEGPVTYNQLFPETKMVMDKKGHSRKKPSVNFSDYPNYEYGRKWTSSSLGYPYQYKQQQAPVATQSHFRQFASQEKQENLVDAGLFADPKWPSSTKKLGQVSAVSLDPDGNVVVFHRGDHVWNAESFRLDNVYKQQDSGPIAEATIVVYSSKTGEVLKEMGGNCFYMPHGLTVDSKRNLWLTDVAMHQVFKFSLDAPEFKPLLTLGTAFVPGNDDTHFCKPSATAVMTQGDFFVSDGYCNARIVKYNSRGEKLLEWGRAANNVQINPPPYAFAVPHALTLAEDKGLVCVADREDGRTQCFTTYNGTFHCQIALGAYGSRLFSVAYTPSGGGRIFAVNGPEFTPVKTKVQGFVIDLEGRKLQSTFSPNGRGFENPHDIAVNKDGTEVYVVELEPYKVWKMVTALPENKTAKVEEVPVDHKNSEVVNAASAITKEPSIGKEEVGSTVDPLSMTILVLSVVSIPMLLVILVVVVLRMKRGGHFKRWFGGYGAQQPDKFGLGDFMKHRQGFEKLNTEEESEREDNEDSGSDVEEFKAQVPRA